MKLPRTIFLPLLLAITLLFAQQAGGAHALHHALEDLSQQQNDKKTPHSGTCEKCAAYAQLGSALNVGAYDFRPPVVTGEAIQRSFIPLRFILVIAADARAPPYSA
jgi:hypothetical protein